MSLASLIPVIDRSPLTATKDINLQQALMLMNLSGSPSLLILDQQQPIGIFTAGDLLRLLGSNDSCFTQAIAHTLGQHQITSILAQPLITVTESQLADLFTINRLFLEHNLAVLPVLDHRGQLSGIITPINLLQLLQQEQDRQNYSPPTAPDSSPARPTKSNLLPHHQTQVPHPDSQTTADRFLSYLTKTSDIFVEYDLQLRYTAINPSGATAIGLTSREIIGKTNRELNPDLADRIEPFLQQVLNTKKKVFCQLEISQSSGTTIYDSTYRPITDESGMISGIVGICCDVTEKNAVAQEYSPNQLEQNPINSTSPLKSEFLAKISDRLESKAENGDNCAIAPNLFLPNPVENPQFQEQLSQQNQPLSEPINGSSFAVESQENLTRASTVSEFGIYDEDIVDLEHLHEISGGDVAFEIEVLQAFVEDSEIHLQEAKQALHLGDTEKLRHQAHQIKGASGNLGVTAIQISAAQLERQARNNSLTGANLLLTELETTLELVKAFIFYQLNK